MDFEFGEKEQKLRADIRQFVKENIPLNQVPYFEEHDDEEWAFSMSIAKKLAQKGWLTISWPKEYGGMGASEWERAVYLEEVGYWGIPGWMMGIGGIGWVGPSLMLYGSEELKKEHLPLIASGEPDGVWCTGYSEPDAGSDFANLQTRAERKGDEYIINGQKVWTSAAHRARWCWLAARTDPGGPRKHDGISILIVDMKSKGITVRPIISFYGFHLFNEIFFNDVRIPVTNLVGVENQGWSQLMHSLGFERSYSTIVVYGESKRLLDELVEHATETGAIKRPYIRQKLADVAVEIETLKVLAYETVWKMSRGERIIWEPSRDKAFRDMINDLLSRIGTEIIGAYAQVDPLETDSRWSRLRGRAERLYYRWTGYASAAGTTDNQRNIIGQFGLQLPKSY
ncbi:MAG: acyl-CoA dehydrogenase family protein [Deltaproteobacteria bacterium]|jgi:alkylation response protein AidB-like acyl-CoA dehydrogenase|nr:acyl-CoA dehydrogenase family protein [Deltaproteobacteria bacterium]